MVIQTNFFRTVLSEAFVLYCLFGSVEKCTMISSFLLYLSCDERVLVEKISNQSTEEEFFTCKEFLDFLDQFKCRSKVTKSNVEEILYEIARQELIQKPHIMALCWREHFTELKKRLAFSTVTATQEFYENAKPTAKKVNDLFIQS